MGEFNMKKILCFAATIILLQSCASPVGSPSPTDIPTRQPTLSPEQYPKLADFVLRLEDVPPYLAYFRSYFWGPDQSGSPQTEDLTSSLKEEDVCSFDCVRIKWTAGSRYVGISLIRAENKQKAIEASFKLCSSQLHDATLHWTTPLAPTGFDDCRSEMDDPELTPYTWILGFYGVDVYDSVLIVADVSQLGGSDWGVHGDVLHAVLELQLKKLQSMNFPVSP
jgi:hypothetical protein